MWFEGTTEVWYVILRIVKLKLLRIEEQSFVTLEQQSRRVAYDVRVRKDDFATR